MAKILVVDSDPNHGKILLQYLIDMDDVHLCLPSEALTVADRIKPFMFILQIESSAQMKNFIKDIRTHKEFFNSGVICINQTEEDFKELYTLGADVNLTTQAELDDIYWAAYSLKRRLEGFEPKLEFTLGPYLVNPQSYEVKYESESIKLKPIQMKMIVAFHRHPNRLLTREWLKLNVWGDDPITFRSIDAQISKLKKALPLLDSFLESIYGQGYIFHPTREKKISVK